MADSSAVLSLKIRKFHAGMYFAKTISGILSQQTPQISLKNQQELFVLLPQVLNTKLKRGN